MTDPVPVIAIDGPGGSGKGTLAQRLAQSLGWHFLDSGALYRLVALAAGREGIALDDEAGLARCAARLDVHFEAAGDESRVWLDGEEVTRSVRDEATGEAASQVAALAAVREALTALQRSFRQPPGLVADGRDMGTVIFPDAPLKVFLTASAEERAKRRYKQLKAKGESVSISRLFREIEARDRRDQTRAVSPLKPAADAVVIDSTDMGIEGVLRAVMDLLEEKGLIH